jgi:hypothetical protein
MAFAKANLNYAKEYSQALAQAYPYTLYFGALWSATKPDVKFLNNNTVILPSLTVKGRSNGDRDTIGSFARNFNNAEESKTLKTHRTWNTLVHPRDIDETNHVASIQNITKVMNEEQKFPEMDAEMITALYSLKNALEAVSEDDVLTAANVLTKFDKMMDKMDEKRVPGSGRLLYVDTYTKTLIDTAKDVVRTSGNSVLGRTVSRIDEVEVINVPTSAMKSKFNLKADDGFEVAADAKAVKMMLIHPSVVIPVITYDFAELGLPSALSQGKYTYFEESFEDVFIYNKKHDAIQFYIEKQS